MSQATKNPKQRKENQDKYSGKQTKQKTHDAAPKQNVVAKESKDTVDEKELRRRLKEYETTVEQLLKHNSGLLKEKEEQQIEIQKLHEENTKLNRSNEEIQNIKAELEKAKDLLAQKESENTRLKEDIDNLQKRMTGEVGGLENVNNCLDSILHDRHDHVHFGAETTPEAMMQPEKIQPEPFLFESDHNFEEMREKFVTLERDSSHTSVASGLEANDVALELPDKIKCHSSSSSNCDQAEDTAKTCEKTEMGHNVQDHDTNEDHGHNSGNLSHASKTTVMAVNCKTDFQNETKSTDDTESSDNRNKLNESGNDLRQSQIGKGDDEQKDERKRIFKTEVCTENFHKEANTEEKYKQKIVDVEVSIKELTDEKNTLLNRPFEVKKEKHEEEGIEERERILKAESCTKILQESGIEDKYKQKIKELEACVKELTNENNQLSNSPSQDKTKEEERKPILKAECRVEYPHDQAGKEDKYKRKIEQLEVCVKELKEEKNKLLNRLSEIGAMKMTDNNPNVTDLSDANRPESLVEQFSELYDNEWTDAYLHLTKTEGKTIERSVKLLLQIVKETYDLCLSSATEKATNLRKALLSYAGLSDQDSNEFELQEIEKTISEYRTKKSQCNIALVEKEVKHRFLNRSDHFETDISSTVTSYIDTCVRICWFMCIKNPPMLLDFGETEESFASNVNKPVISFFYRSKFMPYTKSGDYVEYVVWPAVFLHEDGPIMKKGVAQGSHA